MAKLHVQWHRNCFKIILYDVLSANVWFVYIFYIPIPFVLCRNSLGERELGWEGSRRVALDVFPVVLSCKQSSTEHQSSTENKNRPSSASFQQWENRPGPRTVGLQSCRKSEEQCLLTWSSIVPLMHHQCWGLGRSGKRNARFYMFR